MHPRHTAAAVLLSLLGIAVGLALATVGVWSILARLAVAQ